MPNELTGDFDVVAEFAIPAANRVLAAMHRSERFLHSITLRVDDNPPPGPKADVPTVVGSVDAFGDATVDHSRVGTRADLLGHFSAADPRYLTLDPVVNTDLLVAPEPLVPSRLQGRAQLQLAPPTIEVPDGSGTNIRVQLPMMARYFPDPHTPPVAEFVRGRLQVTAAVNQEAWQAGNVAAIDIKAVSFNHEWSSQPLSPEDLAGINQLMRNALKTGFLPSNEELPDDIRRMRFKTLLGAQNAIAVLRNLGDVAGTPSAFNNVFLGAGDDFAFAAGRDFILAAFPEVRDHRIRHFGSYDVSDTRQTLDLQDGKFLVTVRGHVHRTSWPRVDFNFKVTQALTLTRVATPPGGPLNTAELSPLGDVSLEISGLPWGLGWLVDLFKGRALGPHKRGAR